MSTIRFMLAALLLGGCAATPEEQPADVSGAEQAQVAEVIGQDKSKWICKHEKMLGSNRIEKICYTRDVAKSLRQRTQDGMFRRVRNSACTDCQDGG